MKQIIRNINLYFKIFGQQIKSTLEYRGDFWVMLATGVLTQVTGYLFLRIVLGEIPTITGWTFWEVSLIYAMIYFTQGFCSFFFEGIWRIGSNINSGTFDIYLTRPISATLQIFSSAVGVNGFANMLLGLIMIISAFVNIERHLSFVTVSLFVIFVVCAIIIRVCILFIAHLMSFCIKSPSSALAMLINNISDFAKYPLSIFPKLIQVLLILVIPYAFVSYYPAVFIFDKSANIICFLAPVVAALLILIAYFAAKLGYVRYESVGH